MNTIETWNRLVTIKQPTIQQIQSSAKKWIHLRTDMKKMIYLGDNTVLMLDDVGRLDIPIRLIGVFNPNTYAGIPLSREVQFGAMPKAFIYNIPTHCSAADFAKMLRKQQYAKVELSTISDFSGRVDYWEINYGNALTFQFKPYSVTAKDPSFSFLDVLMFSYQQPYTGTVPPLLQ